MSEPTLSVAVSAQSTPVPVQVRSYRYSTNTTKSFLSYQIQGKRARKHKVGEIAPRDPTKHPNRWTTPEQFAILDSFRERYLEHRAKKTLYVLWPVVETAFLGKFSVSDLCTQLDIAPDDSLTAPDVTEVNLRKPVTAVGSIKKASVPHVTYMAVISSLTLAPTHLVRK